MCLQNELFTIVNVIYKKVYKKTSKCFIQFQKLLNKNILNY